MLSPSDITRLKLSRSRIAAHSSMPPPRYVSKPLIGQFAALSDAILTELLGINPDAFAAQLENSRRMGAEYITPTIPYSRFKMGVSAVTSLIKSGDLLSKNLIVPTRLLKFDPVLEDHLVIGAFIRGKVEDGVLVHDNEVEIAGWTTAKELAGLPVNQGPASFQSCLNVTMLPCSSLRPIDTLWTKLHPECCAE